MRSPNPSPSVKKKMLNKTPHPTPTVGCFDDAKISAITRAVVMTLQPSGAEQGSGFNF
jgi:hypothetical protein